MAAVSMQGAALQVASSELAADKEVVMAAVSTDGDALAFASPALQDDEEVVLAAIASHKSKKKGASAAPAAPVAGRPQTPEPLAESSKKVRRMPTASPIGSSQRVHKKGRGVITVLSLEIPRLPPLS